VFKDLLGKELRVGDHIVYIQSWADKNIEEAIVTQCNEECVRVEYLGRGSPPKYQWNRKKAKGKKSRFTATDKKVIIMAADGMDEGDRSVFNIAMDHIAKEVKKAEAKLLKAAKEKIDLLEEIEILQAEVDKVHSRWNILDL